MAGCGVEIKSNVGGGNMMRKVMGELIEKCWEEMWTWYYDCFEFYEQETKKVNERIEDMRRKIAELKDDYIAVFEQKGEANRHAWYGRIEYLEEKIEVELGRIDGLWKRALKKEADGVKLKWLMCRYSKIEKEELGDSQGGGGNPSCQ